MNAPRRAAAVSSAAPFGWTDLSLLLMAAIWGINFSAVKYATPYFHPLGLSVVRVSAAAVALAPFALLAGDRSHRPAHGDVMRLLGLGALGNGIYQMLFINGVARTHVGNAALIVAASPAMIAIISRAGGVERVGRRAVAGVVLSFVGVGLVIAGSATARGGSRSTLVGTLLVLAGSVCWSFFTVGLKPLMQRVDALRVSALTMAGGLIPLAFVAPSAIRAIEWPAIPMGVWLAFAYSAFISMVVAYFFWYRGIRVIGPTRTAVYANVQPIIAILVAWIALHEVPTLWQGIGSATIITGVLLTRS